ncbi:MAG: MFS transporter [Clostridiaceae bacterium]|jgi:fucose permease|nr:MFS transporter [Clostridiaceae bacterium]
MKYTYKHTLHACCLGYITQAIINNLTPLLFVTFQREFSVSLEQIGLLISFNFAVQLLTDLVSIKYVDRIGYRRAAIIAHVLSFLGLIALAVFPFMFSSAYLGLLIAMMVSAMGGGLLEVLISPIVESLPGEEKASVMSLLHSFYCWGHVAVVVVSTGYFLLFGVEKWFYLPLFWATVPLLNMLLFFKVPLRVLVAEEERIPLLKLFKRKFFWLFFVLMVCAGASEQAMSQWASLFAETGLGVSKTMGDLLGPCAFAILMGSVRTFYGIKGSKINLEKMLIFSSILCVACYLLAVFSQNPLISLVGCSLCGFAVGMMWPGTFSMSARNFPQGGTAMFAVLALAGDLGCSMGPGLVGLVSNTVKENGIFMFTGSNINESGLKTGLFAAIIFPILMWVGVAVLKRKNRTV